MNLPSGSFAIVSLIVLALPTFIWSGVRRWARGELSTDRNVGLSFARGATFTVILTCGYLLVFGEYLYSGISQGFQSDTFEVANPRLTAASVLVLYVVVPLALSIIINRGEIEWNQPETAHWRRLSPWLRIPRSRTGYTSKANSAWDFATTSNEATWLKILRSDGTWVGGWYTGGSFVTAYPEPPSVYLAQQWRMGADGTFLSPLDGTGFFTFIRDDDCVFWTKPGQTETE